MKRLLAFVFATILVGQAWAEDFTIGNLKYTITDAEKHEVSVGKAETKPTGDLVIPMEVENNGVKYSVISIGEDTFFGCSSLTSVDIPNSVISIGKNAFYGCSSLTSIDIPNSVTNIEEEAFRSSGLESIVIPNSVTSIESYTFADCSGLKSVAIPNSVTRIYGDAFLNCSSLKTIDIPNSVTHLGGGFASGLESIVIPNSVTNIQMLSFADCYNLKSVVIPNSVMCIGVDAFLNCRSLKTIDIPNSVISIEGEAFCRSGLESIVIPNSVTSIEDWTFADCSSLKSVIIPNSVTSIGRDAFSGCSQLQYNEYDNAYYLGNSENPYLCLIKAKSTGITSCEINDRCLLIADAFKDCSSLTSIDIPNSVISIGKNAFYGCSSLTSIDIPNSVTCIGGCAFFGCSSLTSVDIPNSVISIGRNAFSRCSSLTSIDIPNSVISIGEDPFGLCSRLQYNEYNNAYYLGNSENPYLCLIKAKSVDITSCEINDKCKIVADYAFYDAGNLTGCTSLLTIDIPNSVSSIGAYAFYCCSSLTSLDIPNSVTSIGSSAFSRCSRLQYNEYNNAYYLGNSENPYLWLIKAKSEDITSCAINDKCMFVGIGSKAFSGCNFLTSVCIPNSVKSISNNAFYDCGILTLYCEASSKPIGWQYNWNYDNRPVVWGYNKNQGGNEQGGEQGNGNENQGGNNEGGNNEGGNNEGGNNEGGNGNNPATAIVDDATSAVNIYVTGNTIVVENTIDEIRVYNAMGKLVGRDVAHNVSTITVNATGVYIVKTGSMVKRVMVN